MQLVVTGRHVSVTDAMKAYAEEKAGRLPRFFNRIEEIRMILDFEAGQPKVEGIVDVEHAEDFVASESNSDMYAAIDAVTDKLERQLTKHHKMITQRHKGRTGEREKPTEESPS